MSTQEQVILANMLDEIIPENRHKGIPAGGSSDVCAYVETALKDCAPDWASLLAEILAFGVNDSTCNSFLHHLEASKPALFQRIRRFAYIGYYGRAEARPHFGLSAEPTQPGGYAVPPESPEFLAELTASVTSRGACYRAIPTEEQPNEE